MIGFNLYYKVPNEYFSWLKYIFISDKVYCIMIQLKFIDKVLN